MRRSRQYYTAGFLLLTTAFLWGLYQVLLIPLRTGQAWSPYSSYRADPLGLSVLYNAFSSQEHLEVQRNEHSLMQFRDGDGATLILAGVYDSPDFRPLVESLEQFVQSGGRLAITYLPSSFSQRKPLDGDSEAEEEGEAEAEADADAEEEAEEEADADADADAEEEARKESRREAMESRLYVNIKDQWDFQLDSIPLSGGADTAAQTAFVTRAPGAPATLPETILWRSSTVLTELAEHWEVLYTREAVPVLIERKWGSGSIVIATDTYFLSNEAMQRHRYPVLLAWFAGPNLRILFDETHHGISRDPGIVALMRRYRLTPVLFSAVVLALLFMWKSSASLVPRRPLEPAQPAATSEAGRSAAAGLNSLLRRSIPANTLLRVCVDAWRQDCSRRQPVPKAAQDWLESTLQHPEAGSPSHRQYNEISARLNERNRK